MQNLNKIFKSHLYNGKSNLLLSRELYLFKKSALGKSENESINNIIEGNTQFENTTEQQIIEDNLESKNNIKKNNKEFQIAKSRKLYLQKSNVKKKLYAIIDLMINYKNISIPKYLLNVIKSNNTYLDDMEKSQQKDCYDFFKKYSKEEILVIFFLSSNNNDEISFIKTSILNKKFVDMLFRSIDKDNLL